MIIFIATFFSLIGFILLWFEGHNNVLIISKDNNYVKFFHQHLFSGTASEVFNFPLDKVKGADIKTETSINSKGHKTVTYSACIVEKPSLRKHKISNMITLGNKTLEQKKVNKINNFLNSERTYLEIIDYTPFAKAFGLIFILAGIGAYYLFK